MTEPPTRTVLLVDDDQLVLSVLRYALTQAGYRVLSAIDGQEALAHHDAHGAVDFLITDLNMPYLGGQELARKLRGKQPNLPIVFLSGETAGDTMPSTEEFPNHLFFHKPIFPSELIEQLPAWLAHAGDR